MASSLRAEVLDKFSLLVTLGLGLGAAIAWHFLAELLFTVWVLERVGAGTGEFAARVLYAAAATVAAVVATVWIARWRVRTLETLEFPKGWSRMMREELPPLGPFG